MVWLQNQIIYLMIVCNFSRLNRGNDVDLQK